MRSKRACHTTLRRVAFEIDEYSRGGRNFSLTHTPWVFFFVHFLPRQKNTHFEPTQNVRLSRHETIRILPGYENVLSLLLLFFFFQVTPMSFTILRFRYENRLSGPVTR